MQHDHLLGDEAQSALGHECVRIQESRCARALVDADGRSRELPVEHRVRADVVDDLAHARQQARIIQHRLADGDAVTPELPRVAA